MTLTGIAVSVIVTKIRTNNAALRSGSSANWQFFPACLSYVDRCFGDITSGIGRHCRTFEDIRLTLASKENSGASVSVYHFFSVGNSQFSSKNPAATIFPGQRADGGVPMSTTAKSGSLGTCRALLR